jgi:hypothetical protein
MAVLKKGELSSIIHNKEVSDEIVKWGSANGYPVEKAKLFKPFGTYCGFSPSYFIRADRRPPVPGGWDITVEDFEPETRIIPLNVDKEGNVNRFVLKMVEEFRKEGLEMKLADKWYDSYGYPTQWPNTTKSQHATQNIKITNYPMADHHEKTPQH